MVPVASSLRYFRGSATGMTRSFATLVRLTKRMGELNMCSRREADRWIRDGFVSVDGKVAEIGEKVQSNLSADQIQITSLGDHNETSLSFVDGAIATDMTVAVMLNKPPGYVSGQAEHGHQPAMRLLTRERLWNRNGTDVKLPQNSWKHFAPAGRLDYESTGLMIFSRSGVISKMIIHHESPLEKEYVVEVAPAVQASRIELELDDTFQLPQPSLDLALMTSGGGMLLGEQRPLLPCAAKWLKKGSELQIILKEGRKRQIRRACRELLGYHVVSLVRKRIGPINLGDLPEGCWRPLTKKEVEAIIASRSS